MEKTAKQESKIEEGFLGQKMIVLSPDRIMDIEDNPLSKNLYATAIGYYPHATSHQRERKFGSEQYILLYCVSGKGWIKVNDEEFTLTANTYFILCKNAPHSYGSSLKDPWSIYWMHFTGETADFLYDRYTHGINSIPYDKATTAVFDQIFHLLEGYLGTREIELIYIKLLQFFSSFVYVSTSPGTDLQDT
ncbi:MAG: AraC family transcriptional regulator, partial [Chitinophagaceae bacterium]